MTEHSGIPHDLDGPTPNAPLPDTWARVKVYKQNGKWTWHHNCPWRSHSIYHGGEHNTQQTALAFAWDHAKRCL